MAKPPARAKSSTLAPNCSVFDVIAKYFSARSLKSLLLLNVIASRSSAGNAGGGLNAGWNPPIDSAKHPIAAPAHAHRHAAGDRELAGEPRVVEHGVERDRCADRSRSRRSRSSAAAAGRSSRSA